MSDFDEDEAARRLAAKWEVGKARPINPLAGFTDEQKRMAERFAGRDNARRIANAKEGRRVRIAPVRVTYEWYWFRYGGGYSNEHWCWRVNRIENGHQREQHAEGTDPEQLEEVLTALREKGIVPVDANGDLEPAKPKGPTVSKRKAIINSLRFYRP